MIEACDGQYVRLEPVLTTEWYKKFMEGYARLHGLEDNIGDEKFQFSTEISPLTQHMIDRSKRMNSDPNSVRNQILIKYDQMKLKKLI